VVPFLAPDAPLRDALKDHLAARLPTVRDWKPRAMGHTIAFVGQSGVGKTSAAVGLAGRYRAAGLAVALVAAGAGAHDALEGHARRLDIQLFRAANGPALSTLCSTLGDRDLIVIDTEGCSHQHLEEIEELAALLGPVKADEVHLVLPAATPVADLGDAQRRFRMAGVNRLTMTKLDETRYHGNLINVPLRMGKPLGFLSDGTSVTDALAPADACRVAEMLLP
jgi:flagellar biosynthesis protein FlhF